MRLNKLSSAVVAALITTPVVAQDTPDKAKIETIEVTATKRTESIQSVPVAVSALNGEALENLGVDNFQEYVEFLPNVVFQGTGPGQNEVYIRGAATTQTNIAVSSVQALQPAVAIYLDEQPVSMQGRNLDVYATDVERVEVLPGPQGTLFGASSQAGTVRVITNKPDHTGFAAGFDSSFSTTKEGEMSNSVEAYFNVAPTDNLALRLAVYNDRQGGWIDNVENVPGQGGYIGSSEVINRISGGVLANGGDTPVVSPTNNDLIEEDFNDAVYSGARFGLSYDFNMDWNLLVQHTEQTLDTDGVFAYDPNLEGETSTNRFVPENNTDQFGLTTWTLSGRYQQLELLYTGGNLDREVDSTIDYTGYTNGGLFSAFYVCSYGGSIAAEDEVCLDPTKFYKEQSEITRTTHEFRVNTPAENRWRVTAGVYYDDQEVASVGSFQLGNLEKFTGLAATTVGTDGINSDGGPFNEDISFVNDVTHGIEQIAFFGQFEFDLTDSVTASLGARYYEIDDQYTGSTTTVDVSRRLKAFGTQDPDELAAVGEDPALVADAIANGQLDISLLGDDGVLTVDDTIYKATIDWQATDNVLFFATYGEGFRPPVTNRVGGGLASNQSGVFENFRIPVYSLTDTLTNYEIGTKGDYFDGILRVNATAYYSEIEELQTSRFDSTNISFLVFTDNVGDAEIQGLDADLTFLATDNLVIKAAFSLMDTELTRLNDELAGIAPPVGSRLPFSAEFSGNVSARYFFELQNGYEGYANAAISYTGDRLVGMKMDAFVVEDATQLIYGTGSGLEIEQEAAVYDGVTYLDSNGETFQGGRYVQESYAVANVAVGLTRDSWKAELFVDNLTDERAQQYIDTQQFTPKVVTNRPRTVGVRVSYDFF